MMTVDQILRAIERCDAEIANAILCSRQAKTDCERSYAFLYEMDWTTERSRLVIELDLTLTQVAA